MRAPDDQPPQRRLRHRLAWFALLWVAGVLAVLLLAALLRLVI